MFKKAYTLLLVLALLLTAGLAGCSGSDKASNESSSKKTIKFMHLWPAGSSKQQNLIVSDIIKQYEANHKDVKIEVEVLENEQYKNKMKVLSSSNELPDVGFTWAAGYMTPFVKGKLFSPLDDVLSGGLKDSFVSGTTEAYALDGKTYGLPLELNIAPIYYNKEIFDKAGVPYPTNDWTWDDFKNVSEKVSSGSGAKRTYGIVSHWILQSFASLPYGGTPYNSDWTKQTIDDPKTIKALELFADLVKSKELPDDAASKSIPMDQMFVSGKAAMYPLGLFEAGEIAKKIGNNFKWGIVLPPKDPNGKNTNIKFQTGFAMNKASKNKKAAWAYIKTISMNKEVNDIYAKVGIPALKESADTTFSKLTIPNTDIKQTDYLNGLADATTFPWGGSINKAADLFGQVWQQITTQKSSAEEAVKKYAPQIQAALDEVHQKQSK